MDPITSYTNPSYRYEIHQEKPLASLHCVFMQGFSFYVQKPFAGDEVNSDANKTSDSIICWAINLIFIELSCLFFQSTGHN